MKKAALFWVCVFAFARLFAQATPFKKSVLDSLKANEFNGSFSYLINLGQDGTSTLTTALDFGVMYSTKRSNYELVGSSFFSHFESTSTANRFYTMLRGSLLSHKVEDGKLIEKRFYPEPFIMYSYDANRAINYRWQFGANGVYEFKPGKFFRMKVGAGLLYEVENWQMVKKENVHLIDTLSDAEQKYLFDTIGINTKGQLYRNNIRLNLYTNFICQFTRAINLSAYVGIQQPFVPPYHDLPPNSLFPVVTKRYPRLTIDTHLTFQIWKVLNLVTDFTMQYDKGQIPLYVPGFVYALTQGFQVQF
ncbi:MAG: hypothetical protein C5B52_17670 [Bacteroidetes bacterium]|nr:MAG: hypothetical protein C5B52_17670 [Bacteroidota bacterium]